MAEFLLRGYNVAIPEVDIGDDIFVVQDSTGTLSKIQVKTSRAYVSKKWFSGKFNIKIPQLRSPDDPALHYVFAVRLDDGWGPFVVIKRGGQDGLYAKFVGLGLNENLSQTSISFRYSKDNHIVWRGNKKSQDLSVYRNNWDPWPVINH